MEPAAQAISALLNELTDGFARGRLTGAELAAISPEELDTFFEIGAQRLDAGHHQDAMEIFAGLVALYPYMAKFWRGYGIALHRLLLLRRALAAYQAALLLEPDHLHTLCYAGEAHVYLGEFEAAQAALLPVSQGSDTSLRQRADNLLAVVAALLGEPPDPPIAAPQPEEPWLEPPKAGSDGSEKTLTFVMADGRPLPLTPSRYNTPTAARPPTAEEEVTMVFGRPLPADEITQTATDFIAEVVALSDPLDGFDEDGPGREFLLDSTLQIAMPAAKKERTLTAIIPGRPRARVEARQKKAPRPPGAEITAVVRRRRLIPLTYDADESLPIGLPQPIDETHSGHRYDSAGERRVVKGESEFSPDE